MSNPLPVLSNGGNRTAIWRSMRLAYPRDSSPPACRVTSLMNSAAHYVLRSLGVLPLAKRTVWKYRIRQNTPVIDLRSYRFNGRRSIRAVEIQSQADYADFMARIRNDMKPRRELEAHLIATNAPVRLSGVDPLHGKPTEFYLDATQRHVDDSGVPQMNFRESLVCLRTTFPSRIRATLLGLYELLPHRELRKLQIYLTEQTTPLYRYFRRNYAHVTGSEYLGPAKTPGQSYGGIRHEDLTGLSFPADVFDVALCLEVLEHVPDYRKAIKELGRVLRPGGLAFITVPFDCRRYEHLERVRFNSDGTLTHLLPPDLHGDPVNPAEGILCLRYFGWTLMDELRDAGFKSTGTLFSWDLDAGVIGEDLMVIYARK
jgi:SAM-dependent methyltransferase